MLKSGPAADDRAPTIISSARKSPGPDAQHTESLIGRRLGHFELLESVGVGGMAAVIKATDLDLGRLVALKILPPDMAAEPENITRFKQEARSAARLDHENIARVYYCGEDQGLHFIAFEYVEGENLRVRMEKYGGRLPVAEALQELIQVTAGLSHAASRGVVHRDIKPSNIIATPDGKAKIVDMGLARNLDPKAANGQLTQSGVTLGTFDYISPEQAIEPRSADCRSDIYSLGCTFYHVLTGHPPVPEGTAAKKLHCHQHVAPLDPRDYNPEIPDELAAVLGKMMAKDPKQRYQHPDHLLQHLLVVAEQLNLPTGKLANGSVVSPYVDRPLPEPPGLSAIWIGVAAIALVIGVFAITGGFGGGRQPLDRNAYWENGAASANSAEKLSKKERQPQTDQPMVSSAKGPQEARNTTELVALLKQPNVHIKLRSGVVYDLTRISRKEAGPYHALFEGNNLILESDRLVEPPTIRLAMAAADDGRIDRPGSLTIRALEEGATATVRLRGIRFEFVADADETGRSGIALTNIDDIDIQECSFVPPALNGMPDEGSAALAVVQLAPKQAMVHLDRCWFSAGSIGVLVRKNGDFKFRLSECAFAPLDAAVFVQAAADESDPRKPAEIRLESCSALMTHGAVVTIDNQVPCELAAGWCLFSNPDLPESEAPRAVLIRQIGALAPETRFEGLKIANAPMTAMPNGYHRVLAYANGDLRMSFEDAKQEQIPITDPAARILTRHPWAEEHPIKRLADFPRQIKQSLAVDLKQEILRLEPDKNRNLLGVKHLPGSRVYDFFPYESPVADSKLASNYKVWQPDFPENTPLPLNVYRRLNQALDELKKGDVLVIRHHGQIEIEPVEFKKPDTDLTIRADEGFRPVLIPQVPSLKKESALFKLFGGQLTLEGLRFRLKGDRAPAVVSLPGGGQATIRNCGVVLEDADDLSMVALADPRGEMMMMGMTTPDKWPTPRIVIENSFIRGRGRLLNVSGSRPFDLRAKNVLAVLDGSLIAVDPASGDITEANIAQVALERVTTYLTRNLLHQKGVEKRAEGKGVGLVQLQIHPTQCLFVPALDQAALIALERVDSIEQMESVFQWKDARQNVYGFKSDQIMLNIQPDNTETAMRVERIDRDRWLGRWREAEYAFGEVNFAVTPATRRFDGVKLSDFDIKSIMPPIKDGEQSGIGASIDALRKLGIEE